MWWMLQIAGCAGVVGIQMANRHYGICITSWVIYALGSMFVTYFSLGVSFAIAPSFFSAWFVGMVGLSVGGLLGSFLVFKDPVSTTQLVGLVFSLIGGYLLIK